MNIAMRARGMLFDSAVEWQRIELENGDPAYILSHYVAVLALIPALCGFIGASVIGVAAAGGGSFRVPIVDGLFGAIFDYVMTCGTVLMLAVIIDLVAPWFGGRRNFDGAFRLAAFSFTPVWLAGIFLILPGLHFLVLTAFYGAYVLWLGAPRMMAAPTRRSQDFTVVIVVCAFVLSFITAMAQNLVFGTPGL